MGRAFEEARRQVWARVLLGMQAQEEDAILKDGRGNMKKCHACGQKLPLKVGDIVEGKHEGKVLTGMVVHAPTAGQWADVTTFSGQKLLLHVKAITRLHGYYRITERETL